MIPVVAVEAAVQASSRRSDWGDEYNRKFIERALEAAAPHMLRDSWIEGFNTGMEYGEWWAGPMTSPEPDNSNSNPYGGRA